MWAFSFVLGAWAHVFSDTLDSVGVMLFWPLTDWHMHFDVWEYVGEAGRKARRDRLLHVARRRLGPALGRVARDALAHVHGGLLPHARSSRATAFWLWLRTKRQRRR